MQRGVYTSFDIDGRRYAAEVLRRQGRDDAVQIVIPAFMPNLIAERMTRVCVASAQRFTEIPHVIWLVDDNSPARHRHWLRRKTDLNVVMLNTVSTQFPRQQSLATRVLYASPWRSSPRAIALRMLGVSYAKAACFEAALRCLGPNVRHVYTMDSDCLMLRPGWLSYLHSKLTDEVRVVGAMRDRSRVHAVPSNGCLFDLQLFRRLHLDMLPNIRQVRTRDMPEYDAADLISLGFWGAGFRDWVARNTYNEPELVDRIPAEHPLRHIEVTRCFDGRWELAYAHMGRGAPKTAGLYRREGKTYPEQWVQFAEEYLLA